MTRRIQAIFVALLFLSNSAPVQSQQWITQAPYPADVDCLGIYFVSADTGWISGDDNLLMKTTDGGQSWNQAGDILRSPQFSENPIWDVQFVDANKGWAWGNVGYRTTDGGATWQQLPFVDSIYNIHFLNSQTGYLISNLAVYRTDDGGQSTTMVWNWEDFNFVYDGSFISPTEGLLAAEEDDVPGIFRTTDSGNSWQRISNQALGRILHLDANVVIGIVGARFYRSNDGGITWTLVLDDHDPEIFNNAMESLTRIDADSAASIDINGRIWITHDAGQTWTRTRDAFGNWGYGWDIQFPTPACGYATGRMGLILKSTDGGATWNQINNGAATQINDIVMADSGTGIAVGDLGVVLRTEDFGQQWTLQPQLDIDNIAVDLNAVNTLGGNSFAIGGTAFYRTDDGGVSWTRGGALPNVINDLSFTDSQTGWACSAYQDSGYAVSKTVDGGATWTVLQAQNFARIPSMIQMMPSGVGWILQPQSEGATTTDGFEQSFIPLTFPSGDSWQWFEFANDNVGWFGGFFGTVKKTTDGGFTLLPQTLPNFEFGGGGTAHRLRDVRVVSATEAYIATLRPGAIYDGVIYQTNDGDTWTEMSPIRVDTNQAAGALGAMDIVSSGEIWVTGGIGFIFASGIPEGTTPPESNKVADGVVTFGQLSDIYHSDDQALGLDPSPTTNPRKQQVDFIIQQQSTTTSPSSFALRLEAKMSGGPVGDVIQTMELFDYTSGRFEVVDLQFAQLDDTVVEVAATGDLSRFVQTGTNEITARVLFNSPEFSGSPFFWSVDIDQLVWIID